MKIFSNACSPVMRRHSIFVTVGPDTWDQGHRDDLEGGGLMRSGGDLDLAGSCHADGSELFFDARILGGAISAGVAQARQKGRFLAQKHHLRDDFETEILRSVP